MFDYDTTTDHTLSFGITVTDGIDPPATATMTIHVYDVNDNAPVFSPPTANVSFNENAAVGLAVQQFTATDADSGENAEF